MKRVTPGVTHEEFLHDWRTLMDHRPGVGLLNPEAWLEEHGDYLFRYAWRRLRDRSLAEDLVQETLLAAFAKRSDFHGKSTVRTWLLGILRHKLVDAVRRLAREVRIEDASSLDGLIEGEFDAVGEWAAKPSEWQTSPAEAVERGEFWRILEECLAMLPRRLYSAFVLRELEEMGNREVSRTLDVSPVNLGVMLHRARLRLRRCLEVEWGGQGR